MRFRFKTKPLKPGPKIGDNRIITKFLFIPMELIAYSKTREWVYEIRWLEKCKVHQTYVEDVGTYDTYPGWRTDHWVNE